MNEMKRKIENKKKILQYLIRRKRHIVGEHGRKPPPELDNDIARVTNEIETMCEREKTGIVLGKTRHAKWLQSRTKHSPFSLFVIVFFMISLLMLIRYLVH